MRVRVQGKWKYMASDPTDNKLPYPQYKCMNCNVYVMSSRKDAHISCPECRVAGTMVKEKDAD